MKNPPWENLFQCGTCGMYFGGKASLTRHKKIHTKDKPSYDDAIPHKCHVCGNYYAGKSSLTRHLKIHSGIKPFKCETCGKGFIFNRSLVLHIRTHTGEKPFKCDVCGKRFTGKSPFLLHKKTHTGEAPHKCKICGKRFLQNYGLTRHMRSHTKEKLFSCDTCGKGFSLSHSLRDHMRIHTGERPFECSICKKRFKSKTSLNKHTKTHAEEKPCKCITCGKGFTTKNTLLVHTYIHTGEKPFTCKFCGKSFSQPYSCTRHIRMHTGEQPYKCEVCGKRFTHLYTLVQHRNIHTGEKPYKCDACGKCFSMRQNIRKHIRIHLGNKPYKCHQCGKCFARKFGLARHITIHTNDITNVLGRDNIPAKETIIKSLINTRENGSSSTEITLAQEDDTVLVTADRNFIETHKDGRSIKNHDSVKTTKKRVRKKRKDGCLTDNLIKENKPVTIIVNRNSPRDQSSGSVANSKSKFGKEKPDMENPNGGYTRHNGSRRHSKTHTREKPCANKVERSQTSLDSRISLETKAEEKMFTCSFCEKRFRWKRNLMKHRKIHTGTMFKCRTDGETFGTFSSFTKQQTAEGRDKSASADTCLIGLGTRNNNTTPSTFENLDTRSEKTFNDNKLYRKCFVKLSVMSEYVVTQVKQSDKSTSFVNDRNTRRQTKTQKEYGQSRAGCLVQEINGFKETVVKSHSDNKRNKNFQPPDSLLQDNSPAKERACVITMVNSRKENSSKHSGSNILEIRPGRTDRLRQENEPVKHTVITNSISGISSQSDKMPYKSGNDKYESISEGKSAKDTAVSECNATKNDEDSTTSGSLVQSNKNVEDTCTENQSDEKPGAPVCLIHTNTSYTGANIQKDEPGTSDGFVQENNTNSVEDIQGFIVKQEFIINDGELQETVKEEDLPTEIERDEIRTIIGRSQDNRDTFEYDVNDEYVYETVKEEGNTVIDMCSSIQKDENSDTVLTEGVSMKDSKGTLVTELNIGIDNECIPKIVKEENIQKDIHTDSQRIEQLNTLDNFVRENIPMELSKDSLSKEKEEYDIDNNNIQEVVKDENNIFVDIHTNVQRYEEPYTFGSLLQGDSSYEGSKDSIHTNVQSYEEPNTFGSLLQGDSSFEGSKDSFIKRECVCDIEQQRVKKEQDALKDRRTNTLRVEESTTCDNIVHGNIYSTVDSKNVYVKEDGDIADGDQYQAIKVEHFSSSDSTKEENLTKMSNYCEKCESKSEVNSSCKTYDSTTFGDTMVKLQNLVYEGLEPGENIKVGK